MEKRSQEGIQSGFEWWDKLSEIVGLTGFNGGKTGDKLVGKFRCGKQRVGGN